MRLSYKNPAVMDIYREFLEKPGSHTAHELLHTLVRAAEGAAG